MKKTLFILLSVFVLFACTRAQKEYFGLIKQGPDETKVETRKPLSIPPEFGLRPTADEVNEK